jgi:hypothetical protein
MNLATVHYVCSKAVNRGDKRSRRNGDFAKFERSCRYRDRYRCQERDRYLVFRDPPHRERELDR